MNTLQNVYDRLSDKTELAKHEVELGLVDDLAKLLGRMKAIDSALMKSTQKALNSLTAFSKLQGDLQDAYANASLDSDDADKDIKEAIILIDKVAKQAKDLGLNPNDVKGTQDIVKITENLEDTINTLNKNESDIKKILSI
jgi:Fic family protein